MKRVDGDFGVSGRAFRESAKLARVYQRQTLSGNT